VTVKQTADAYRRRLRDLETQATLEVVNEYDRVLQRILPRLEAVIALIEEQKQAGQPVSPAWLYQQDRYQGLLALVGQEMARYSMSLNGMVTSAQRSAIAAALEAGREIILSQTHEAVVAARFVVLNSDAVENMIATTLSGSLRGLLEGIPGAAVVDAAAALVDGVALGLNPREVSVDVRKALGVTMTRALTITRTEMLRASRLATNQMLEANTHLTTGWVWLSAMDSRTCPYCWAMTGSHHKHDEVMASHPNCRCAQVPDVVDVSALLGHGHLESLPTAREVVPIGSTRFASLDAAEQERVLGGKAYQAYHTGEISLSDLVGTRQSQRWGRVGYVKSLRQLRREKVIA
jgi:SPP1 gp7 family putative phage head morphogenesis protein